MNSEVGEGNCTLVGNEARFAVNTTEGMVQGMTLSSELYGVYGFAKSMFSLGKAVFTKLAENTDDLVLKRRKVCCRTLGIWSF